MTLSNSNLHSESYSVVESFLSGISGLDPKNRFNANLVHASMPNINAKGFDGYPFLILRVNVSENDKAMDITISQKIFKVLLSVHSEDASQLDAMCDKIYSASKDETKLTDFQAKEMSSSDISYNLDEHGKKVLFRNIGFIMRSRI